MSSKIGIQTWPNGNATYVTDDGRYMIIAMTDGHEWDRENGGSRGTSKIEILDAGKMIYSDEGPRSGVGMEWSAFLALAAMIDFMSAENEAWLNGEPPDEPIFDVRNESMINLITEYDDELYMVAHGEEVDQDPWAPPREY